MPVRISTYIKLSLLLALLLSSSCALQAQELIVHKSTSLSQLSLKEIRSIFSMRLKQWPDGTPITVYVLPDSDPTHQEFISQALMMMPYQLRRHWDRITYTGFNQPPIEVQNKMEMIERVSSTPGAIGYIDQAKGTDNVSVIAIH